MATQQVSIWVPIMVGIIGFVGVIAGQAINAWREDHRWKQQARQDEHMRHADRRFDTYAEMATVLTKLSGLFLRLDMESRGSNFDLKLFQSDYNVIRAEVEQSLGRLLLIGTKTIRDSGLNTWTTFQGLGDLIADEKTFSAAGDKDMQKFWNFAQRKYLAFLNDARSELASAAVPRKDS